MQIHVARATGDITAWGALVGWFVGVLPSIATGLTAIWFAILIAEKITGVPMHEMVRRVWDKIRGR